MRSRSDSSSSTINIVFSLFFKDIQQFTSPRYSARSRSPPGNNIRHSGNHGIGSQRRRSRQRERKRGALAEFRVDPNLSAMPLHNALDNREPHARAGVPLVVNPLEHLKNAPMVLGIDSDTVVPHHQSRHILIRDGRDMNLGTGLASELDRVLYEAQKDEGNLSRIAVEFGEIVPRDRSTVFVDDRLQRTERRSQQIITITELERRFL